MVAKNILAPKGNKNQMDSYLFDVSIVIPVYNMEQYLDRCMESVLAQTLTNIEIILVDDGSNDRSAIICDSYAKKYLYKIILPKRIG